MQNKKEIRAEKGRSRAEEEEKLAEVIGVAQENLERTEHYIESLAGDMQDLLETYETKDKEGLALWNNANSQLNQTKMDLIRCQKARKKPYFGWIHFRDPEMKKEESYYIGRVAIAKNASEPVVIDWRAPIASVYYENVMGPCKYKVKDTGIHEITLKRKRTYEIANDRLIDFFDSDIVATDELLTKYLAKSKKAVLGEIIATIQKEQNEIIRTSPKTNMIVQGVAGSGKTTVAMHRISYILYNFEEFRPVDFYIIGSNRILLNYITSVLPDLDVYGVSQMTMEQLFVRLLYEDWDPRIHKIRQLDQKDASAYVKGGQEWFFDLQKFCQDYEDRVISREEIRMEKNHALLMGPVAIQTYLDHNSMASMQQKINLLNEMLLSKLENELLGKHVTYTEVEKKELQKKYATYFGKDQWKGSIFELYKEFLEAQKRKGFTVAQEENAYDLYDLAALAYLYKRIKETDGIREASHVIIDEAQDFGMMAYSALRFCLRDCTYTIMGDVSQNIHYGYGLNDWEDLKKLILTGMFDKFGLLKKSYRNTVEISNFATKILRHGSFAVYPVEPIIRHGNEVAVYESVDNDQMILTAAKCIQRWQEDGHETIAVICRDEEEAAQVSSALGKLVPIADPDIEKAEFTSGVNVLPVEYTKGLEFDAVLLYHPSKENYPAEDSYVKLLYVAATRALHELAVVHMGDLTDLIAKPVSEEKAMESLEEKNQPKVKRYEKTEYTTQELMQQDVRMGQKDMALRERGYLGPKKIEAKRGSTLEEIRLKKKPVEKKTVSVKVDAAKAGKINTSPYQFGDIVLDNTLLRPKGHGRIDQSIRWIKKTKKYVDIASNYGVLRIAPITEEILHIQFVKGQMSGFAKGYWERENVVSFAWTVKESRSMVQIESGKLVLQLNKADGAIVFMDQSRKKLLAEKNDLARQVEESPKGAQTWNYFDWGKKELLFAKGILDSSRERMTQRARYISFGRKPMRMPLLLSDQGYGLAVNAQDTVMCCAIPSFGPYLYTENEKQIDYYFLYGPTYERIIENYKEITK